MGFPSRDEIVSALASACADQGVVGAQICVVREGVAVEAATGFANLGEGIEATNDTLFQIGSITKVLTAALLQTLVRSAGITIDEPAIAVLPDLWIDGRPARPTMTLRTLLDYTAGVEGDFFEDFGENPDALERYVAACSVLGYIHPPGEMRGYNSTAYCIAGRACEVLSEQPFEEALADTLLTRLGIARFGFSDHRMLRYRSAIGHSRSSASADWVGSERLRLPKAMTAAGASLALSARDLARFGELFTKQSMAAGDAAIVPVDALAEMTEPFGLVPPNDSERLMGWAAMETKHSRFLAASGATIDQNAILIVCPEHDFVLTIMTNVAGGADRLLATIGLDLIARATGERLALPQPDFSTGPMTCNAASLVGTYVNGTIYGVELRNGVLVLTMRERPSSDAAGQQAEFNLRPLCAARFSLIPPDGGEPVGILEFLKTDKSCERPSHLVHASRVFARKGEEQ